MKKISILPEDIDYSLIREVKEVILKGGIVALPTETVYGLAVLATDKTAVEKLYGVKKRVPSKPFTLQFPDVEEALAQFSILPPYGYRLIEKLWPGPLTIIFYSSKGEKIGVRVSSHKILRLILKEVGQPVYLPSANISGEKETLSAEEVEKIFDNKIDLIVDGGKPLYGKSSTVVDLTYHPFKIVREGVVSSRQIVDTYIKKRLVFVCTGNTCRSVIAEYLLKKYLAEYDYYLGERYEIISRGISAPEGTPATGQIVELLREEGIEINHRAKRLDRYSILSADLIFTMEERQKEYILQIEPTAESRVFLLKKFLPQKLQQDIPDPIGKPKEEYRKVFELIKMAILELREWL